MTEQPTRRTVLAAAAATTALSTTSQIVGASEGPDQIHDTTLTDDLTVTNMTGTEHQVSMQLTALNDDETFERSEVVSSRRNANEVRIADLSVPGGRYEFAVETDTQQVTTTVPLSPQGQRRYERLDIRVLPDRLSVENAEI